MIKKPKLIKSVEKGDSLIDKLESRMRPSVDSPWGMLGENESLIDVISIDYQTLKNIGIGYNTIADSIDELFKKPGSVSILERGYVAITEMTCGAKRCPWHDGYDDDAFYTMLLDPCNKEHRSFLEIWKHKGIPLSKDFKKLFAKEPVMIVSGFMPHLIRDHQFFEGKETAYRCDPLQLIKYLNLEKG